MKKPTRIFHCEQFQVFKIRGKFVCRICGKKFNRTNRNAQRENEQRVIRKAIDTDNLELLRKIIKD